jgi:hypothetical protein
MWRSEGATKELEAVAVLVDGKAAVYAMARLGLVLVFADVLRNVVLKAVVSMR